MLSNLAAPTLIKVIIGLAIALGLSIWLNVEALYDLRDAQEDCQSRVDTALANGRIASADRALQATRAMAEAAARENAEAEQRIANIASEQLKLLDQYQRRLARITPLPVGCGPGADRVDAFNER